MKAFTVYHDRCAMKVTTDACLFGAWAANRLQEEIGRFLDIGTGTGLLSLMVAQQSRGTIDAVEIDGLAAGQAGENVAASSFENSIHVTAADIKSFTGENYNAIFTNPPFYEGDLASPSAKRKQAHHDSGLLLSALIPIISAKLVDGGRFFILLPPRRAAEAETLFAQCGLYVHGKVVVRQSPAHAPFRLMYEGKKGAKANCTASEITLRDDQGNYTPEFTRYLQPYYLYL